jgi:uncharacterized protein YecE (DUF72 family)
LKGSELKIGCTGWGYSEWQGTFYPKTIKQKDWLRHYSGIFDITEVNSSFYHLIPKSMAAKWNNETPDNFRFSLKFPQSITHENKLEFGKSRDELNRFFSGLEPLKKKIKVLVLQLPPSLDFETAKPRLEEFEKHLPHFCRYAVEGRNQTWFCSESLRFLSERNICLVWNEVPMVENTAPITTDFVYARIIGDRNLPEDVYDHKVRDQKPIIKKWAVRLKNLEKNDKIKFSWAVLNNHLEGFAPSSANTLRSVLGYKELEFRDKKQASVIDFLNESIEFKKET